MPYAFTLFFLIEQSPVQSTHIPRQPYVAEMLHDMCRTTVRHLVPQLVILDQNKQMCSKCVDIIGLAKKSCFAFFYDIGYAANPCADYRFARCLCFYEAHRCPFIK